MKNFQRIIFILLMTITSFSFSAPVKAQNYLNIQLRNALCRQNWAVAIAVIDHMKQVAPSYINQLNAYRATLVNLRNSRARLAGWPPATYCAGDIPTNTPSNYPTTTPSQNPLNPSIEPTTIPQNNQNTPNPNRTVPILNQGNVG